MIVRAATHADVDRLVGFGQQLSSESPAYSERKFCPGTAACHFHNMIDSGGVIFVVELGGQIVGGIAGSTTKDWFNDDLIAFEQVLYVEPEYRATRAALLLIEAFFEWSKSMNAQRIQSGTTTGIQTKGCLRLYEQFGFREYGTLLDLELQ